MAKAQAKKEDVNTHTQRRAIDFTVGNNVYVSTKNWKTQRPESRPPDRWSIPHYTSSWQLI
jgi:hypothetical protein